MTSVVDGVAAAMAPWAGIYADSVAIQSLVMFVHLGSLLLAGGMAIAADVGAIRAARPGDGPARTAALMQIRAAHRPVLTGLALALASGALLLAADVETFLPSPVLWTKLGLLALLLANGWMVQRTERAAGAAAGTAAAEAWPSMRRAAARSLALWFSLVLVSVVLVNAPGTG
jgi:hypothetical protein